MPRSTTLLWFPLVAVLVLVTTGCDKEEINSYDVPKPAVVVSDAKVKLLAAIFDVKKDQWYFKLVGPKDDVAKHVAAFDKFIASVRFPEKGDRPVEWVVPEGWERGAASELRFATLYPDPKDRSLALTVFKFEKQSALLDNVNRWCERDVGRPHFRKGELDPDDKENPYVSRLADAEKQGAKQGIRVVLEGPGSRKEMAGMKGNKGKDGEPPIHGDDKPLKQPGKSPLTYATPAGWTDTGPQAPTGPFGLPKPATFTITEGGARATCIVSYMRGQHTADFGNVKRWRDEVGLPLLGPEEVSKIAPREVQVDGRTCKIYEFAGGEVTTLVGIAYHGGQTYYFKLSGPNAVIAKNRDKFVAFVQSVKFSGAE
jgi:hypothetical protein